MMCHVIVFVLPLYYNRYGHVTDFMQSPNRFSNHYFKLLKYFYHCTVRTAVCIEKRSKTVLASTITWVTLNAATVPAQGQLSPPPKKNLHVGPLLSASKMEGIGGFTQNAVFTRFCILCIFDLFVRFLINEPDGYESRQLARLTRLLL